MKYRLLVYNAGRCAGLHAYIAVDHAGQPIAVNRKSEAYPFASFEEADAFRVNVRGSASMMTEIEIIVDRE